MPDVNSFQHEAVHCPSVAIFEPVDNVINGLVPAQNACIFTLKLFATLACKQHGNFDMCLMLETCTILRIVFNW